MASEIKVISTIATREAYNELVPQFERLFEREGSDFGRFYAEVKRLSALPKKEREATLNNETGR